MMPPPPDLPPPAPRCKGDCHIKPVGDDSPTNADGRGWGG